MNLLILSVFLLVSITTRKVIAKSISEVDSRVIYGENLRPEEHKYLVHLNIKKASQCSGSIIDKNWIVTAAHCVCDQQLFFKAYSYYTGLVGQGTTAISHSYYNSPCGEETISLKNAIVDLALLKTDEVIRFNRHVQPIPLGRSAKLGDKVIVAGYGVREGRLEGPSQGVVTINDCAEEFVGLPYAAKCSFGRKRPGRGDSGGPITHNGKLVGVVSCSTCSNDNNCKSYYVDIEVLLQWLQGLKLLL